MSNSLAKNFKFFSLLQFAFPTMVMMVFMSLYTIVDGIFISRFVGTDALSAANIDYPVLSLVIAVGVMLSTGGSAVIAKKMGEGKMQEARESFSFMIAVGLIVGIGFAVIGNLFLEPIVRLLGATDKLMPHCLDYLRILLYLAPACILQILFQSFFVTAGHPGIGLALTISGGIANMFLDYYFMGPLHMGIAGAAWATGAGQLIPTVIGLVYFTFCRSSLCLVKFRPKGKLLLQCCANGSSEMVTNLSTAVVTFLFNLVMLRLQGEDGVAAMTIVLYGQFLFNALYMGFSMGVAPVISYNYGADNRPMLQRIFKICVLFVSISSLAVTGLALWTSPVIVGIFTPAGTDAYDLAARGFLLFSLNYIFAGTNIFASSLFTAFSDGKVSALISFVRTFVLIVIFVLALPYFLGVDGVWLSIPAAEAMTLFVSLWFFYRKRKDYHYMAK